MTKRFGKVGNIIVILLCMGVNFGCASDQKAEQFMEEQMITQSSFQGEQETEEETVKETKENGTEKISVQESDDHMEAPEEYSSEEHLRKNEQDFFEEAENQGIERQTAETYLQILMDDNIFQDGTMALTGLRIADIDSNGHTDMLVMVLDAKDTPFYGSGSLWIYINEDEPYCFSEEDCSYYGWFDTFWDDIDNDENIEIVFSAQGTGCGAAGDSYKAVFKYKDHSIERMQLPSDFEEAYDCGLFVEVFQEPEKNRYSAYCPYLDEKISFRAQNIEGWDLPHTAESVGSNARGFYNFCVAEYQGKKVLQASEYLYGEGGVVHNVAIAQFLITWKEDGTPEVVKWWIEEWE